MIVSRLFRRVVGRILMRPDKPKEIPLPNLWLKLKQRLIQDFASKELEKSVIIVKRNYDKAIERIRLKCSSGRKVRVMFLVQCTAKWKCQTVYESLANSKVFEPIIGLTVPAYSQRMSPHDTSQIIEKERSWFESRGYECEVVYDSLKDFNIPLSRFDIDIVFFPEASYSAYHIKDLSKNSLVCYVQYYVPNYWDPFLDCGLPNHRLFYHFYSLNEDWSDLYRKTMGNVSTAGAIKSVGHPMLDMIKTGRPAGVKTPHIIYAPHWSFTHSGNPNFTHIGTFEWNGRFILDYAKAHPYIKWTFKPHPGLSNALLKSGLMTPEEVKEYYADWSRIGAVCDSGDYAQLFYESSLMITDCGSFLSEYGATGKPIINLISKNRTASIPEPSAKVFDSYYMAHNIEELDCCLKMLIGTNVDPKADVRHDAVQASGLMSGNAGMRIVGELRTILR